MVNKKRGFTLIEMIIVISILGILMALVLPKVVGVKNLGVNMQCANNMKTIIQACALYVSDMGTSPTKNHLYTINVFGNLYDSYDENKKKWALTDMKIFTCPNDASIKNPNLLRPAKWKDPLVITNSDAPSPSYAIVPTGTGTTMPDFQNEPDGNVFLTERSLNYHNNGCNMGFYNGSVKFYSLKMTGTTIVETATDNTKSNFPFNMDPSTGAPLTTGSIYQYYDASTGGIKGDKVVKNSAT